ncbi:MAG: PHP domain-containing protein [Lachnospiraceae bacterium]|nr:PHP domain-containing protein [Lachnospiraceae bacterium]
MYFNCHSHTDKGSNIRILDCINKPKDLINKAIELGLAGIAITDHEALTAHVQVNKIMNELHETNPDFTIALGNEIYLIDKRENGQKYYHFILIAKDEIGHKALRELSSTAWLNSYFDRGMERVPLLKEELSEIYSNYKGHLIATTACMGGELGSSILKLEEAEKRGDTEAAQQYNQQIVDFMLFCIEVFGDDFYLECAPSNNAEQIAVNKRILSISKAFAVPITIGTDAHYLTKEDRFVHKAYLNSKNGEREVDSFYEFARLIDTEETIELLKLSYTDDVIQNIFNTSLNIKNKISYYSLEKKQHVTEIEVPDYPKQNIDIDYPILKSLFESEEPQERYWVNECWNSLRAKKLLDNELYIERLEEEARVKRVIGEKLETCVFAYPNTLKHYIDLFWECGSTVGAGRGSACAALNHYLLGITQLDPIEWNLPFWRYLNDERAEMPDVDLDLAPSKIQTIFSEIRKERGDLGLVQVATFGTETTKSAILTACRGYRSEEFKDGIDVDIAQYMSSLVPSERGFLWPLKDVVYGNPAKDRKPVNPFILEVNKYPGLLDIMVQIEGLVNKRSSHASGIILLEEDTYARTALMKTPKGAIITQFDLHDAEWMGLVKYDFLLTSVQDIFIKTIELLQEDGEIEKELSLREIYNKYLHPNVLPKDDKKMWDALANNEVISCFQFDSSVGAQAAKKIRPQNPLEMSDANGLMRLMTAEKGAESPLDKYVRFKNNISLWYKEMDDFGLSKEEQKSLEPYFLRSYGVPPSQEQMMMILQDPNICGFTLKEANTARKIVGKKQMDKIPELQDKILNSAKSPVLGQYVWKYGIGPQMG